MSRLLASRQPWWYDKEKGDAPIPMQEPTVVAPSGPIYQYRVDESDAIIWVDQWWLAFANENGATDLIEANVLGRSIYDFIGGEPTKTLYRELHQYVRSSGKSVTVPFRCDSPSLQRFMQVSIHRQGADELLYQSMLLRVESQPFVRLLDSEQARSAAFLTMCSCCKRSMLEPSGWVDLENISLRLRLFDQQAVPALRYTVCPDCEKQVGDQRQTHPGASSV